MNEPRLNNKTPRNPKGVGARPKKETKGAYDKERYERHREQRLAYLKKWRKEKRYEN